MNISTTKMPMQAMKAAPAPAAQTEKVEVPTRSDSFTFSGSKHYSGAGIVSRAAGGALTGLLANHFSDGSIGGVAKLGAVVNGTIGAGVGAITGGLVGGVAGGGGGALVGAAVAGGVGGAIGAGTGAIKGALIAVVGNALGGGAVAYAGSGAILGALGL